MPPDSRLVGAPATTPPGPASLGGWLIDTAGRAAPGTGLRFLDRHEAETALSWADVLQRALRAAGALQAAGVRRGDTVGIVLPTAPSFTDAWFGCQLLGAVPVALYPPVRLGRLDEYHAQTSAMLALAGVSALVTEARILRILGQTLARYRPPCGIVLDTELTSGPIATPVDVSADAIAMIQFSSGSTVAPKGVALSHRAVIAQGWTLTAAVRQTGPEATRAGVTWLPLYHDMGLIGCIVPALLHPGPLTLIPPEAFLARPALWLRALSRYRGTVSPAPSFAYALCVERIKDEELEGCDLSAWSMALNGAEPVSAALMRSFQERFARWGLRPDALTPVYGLSEASLAVTFDDVEAPFRSARFDPAELAQGWARSAEDGTEIVSVGRPIPGFSIEIRDPTGAVAPAGQIGRIFARGPSLMSHYLGDTPHPVVDGWLDTGDLGFVHQERLYISGRAKDTIILRGRNHAPHEIEQAVDGVECVRTGCSVAVGAVDASGEQLIVFVEVRTAREGLADACRRAVLAATGLDPALVVLLDPGTLPRTSSGKLRRSEALRRWRAGTLTPPDKVGPLLLAGALAKSVLGRLGFKTGSDA